MSSTVSYFGSGYNNGKSCCKSTSCNCSSAKTFDVDGSIKKIETSTTLTILLDGDENNPGNDQYYGTDSTGTRGWFVFPSTSHPPVVATNNASPFAWNSVTQTINIPQSSTLVDNGNGTITYTKGDGSTPITITVGGSSVTNLTYTASATNGVVNSDTGTDATIPSVNGTNAGLATPSMFTNSHVPVTVTDSGSIDFTLVGQNVTATLIGLASAAAGTIPTSNGSGGITWVSQTVGTTNLTYTASPTNGIVNSDTGTDATIPVVDGTNAGLATPSMFTNSHVPVTVTDSGSIDFTLVGQNVTATLIGLASAAAGTVATSDGAGNITWTTPATATVTGANNGTKLTGSNVQLGGPLIANTTVGNSSFALGFDVNIFTVQTVSQYQVTAGSLIALQAGLTLGLTSSAGMSFNDNSGTYTFSNIPAKTTETEVLYIGTGGVVKKGTVGGPSTYSAGAGAIVTASGAGVTFTRTTASNWTVNIPAGIDLYAIDINSSAAEGATTALDIDFVYAGTRPFNQDTTQNMTDAKVPVITTLKKVAPAQYPTTAASNNAAWTADVTTAGTLRISTVEYSEVSGSGAVASTVKCVF